VRERERERERETGPTVKGQANNCTKSRYERIEIHIQIRSMSPSDGRTPSSGPPSSSSSSSSSSSVPFTSTKGRRAPRDRGRGRSAGKVHGETTVRLLYYYSESGVYRAAVIGSTSRPRLCSCDSDRAHLCREHSAADIMAG